VKAGSGERWPDRIEGCCIGSGQPSMITLLTAWGIGTWINRLARLCGHDFKPRISGQRVDALLGTVTFTLTGAVLTKLVMVREKWSGRHSGHVVVQDPTGNEV
jgi:hypothetical protein